MTDLEGDGWQNIFYFQRRPTFKWALEQSHGWIRNHGNDKLRISKQSTGLKFASPLRSMDARSRRGMDTRLTREMDTRLSRGMDTGLSRGMDTKLMREMDTRLSRGMDAKLM